MALHRASSPALPAPTNHSRVPPHMENSGTESTCYWVFGACQPGSSWLSPCQGSTQGRQGPQRQPPAPSPGSSSLHKDGMKRARPGGGQEHPATLQRAGTMSRLSAPARAGSRLPNKGRDGKGLAWKRQELCPLLTRQSPVKPPLCCVGITLAAPKGDGTCSEAMLSAGNTRNGFNPGNGFNPALQTLLQLLLLPHRQPRINPLLQSLRM